MTEQQKQELLYFVTKDEAEGEVSQYCSMEWMSRTGLTPAKQLMLVRATMPVGGSHPFHRHPSMEEIIYVLEGEAEQWVDQDRRILGPGETAHIPTNRVHGTYSVGAGPLVFLAMLSPAEFEGPATIQVEMEEPWCRLRA